nr:ring-h2 finger protein atl22 [Quercus suber]
MEISHRMVIPTLLLFVLVIVDLGECHNRSSELRCGYHGPAIRFPFRLKDRQPDQQRGYPGFDLYCSDNNHTVLELPTSVKTFVNSIDYKSQQINVTVSDGCFPRIIRGLHLPSSPFQFKTENNYLYNYALFNCTPRTDTNFRRIHCLSSRRQLVYAFQSYSVIEDLPILSCTKMYSVSSVPSDIWNSPFLELTWSEPKCGPCELKGEKCRFKNNSTDFNIECVNPYGNKGIVFSPISTFIITTSSSRLEPTCIDLIKLSYL